MSKASAPSRVLFLLQRPEAWINIETLWRALQAHEGIVCTLWALPYNALDPDASRVKAPMLDATLRAAGVTYETWKPEISLKSGEFDAVVVTHPYDRERPRPLWFDALRSAARKIIYVPYGLAVGGGRKNYGLQYAQPVHRHADLVIARSSYEKAQYHRYCPGGDEHVKVTGLPRFDSLAERVRRPLPPDLVDFIGGRRTLLWNSHFSFGQRYSQVANFSTFDLLGPTLFSLCKRLRKELCLLWRPHPLLVPALVRDGLATESSLSDLECELRSLGVWWDCTADHSAVFAASDALVSDPGSFLFEYLVLRRPMAGLVNPDGEPPNAEARLLHTSLPTIRSPDELHGFISRVVAGKALPPQAGVVEQHLPQLDGHAGNRVALELLALIGRKTSSLEDSLSEGGRFTSPPTRASGSNPMRPQFKEIETPTLDALCEALSSIDQLKRRERRWRRMFRRVWGQMKTFLVEWLKQNPTLLALALRRSRDGQFSE